MAAVPGRATAALRQAHGHQQTQLSHWQEFPSVLNVISEHKLRAGRGAGGRFRCRCRPPTSFRSSFGNKILGPGLRGGLTETALQRQLGELVWPFVTAS